MRLVGMLGIRCCPAPGLMTSIRLTLVIGLGSTLITLIASMLIVTFCYTQGRYKTLQNFLAPLLAIPHLTPCRRFGFFAGAKRFLDASVCAFVRLATAAVVSACAGSLGVGDDFSPLS